MGVFLAMADWEDIADDWEQLDEGNAAPWENEDGDDAPDNWDDEDEEDNAEDPFGAVTVQKDKPKTGTAGAASKKKKKIKLKPLKKKQLAKKLDQGPQLDPQEEKIRQLKLQKDSDLQHANDLLSTDETVVAAPVAAQFTPKSKIEFLKFSSMLVDDLSKFEDNEHYVTFVVDLVRKLAGPMTSEQVNEISSALNVLFRQKLQFEKGKKKKT